MMTGEILKKLIEFHIESATTMTSRYTVSLGTVTLWLFFGAGDDNCRHRQGR